MTGETDAAGRSAEGTDAPTATEMVSLADLDAEGRATLFEGEPHTVYGALEAGESVAAHQHPEREIVLHVLAGEIELTLGDEAHSLSAGDLIRFDGRQDISPAAVEDSEILIVLAPRSG